MNENIKNFLQETKFCDFTSPNIQKIAQEITKSGVSDSEKSESLFYWVKENIKFEFGYWGVKASNVLQRKRGMCTNKAVLLTSFLRAVHIPAGFGILKVKGQEYFGPIAPVVLTNKVSSKSVHFYSYVNIDNKWIKIDPSVDSQLAIKTNYFNPTTELTEWSGDYDAMENLDPKNILEDLGPLFFIDDRLQKKPKKAKNILFKIGNYYLDFLRGNNIKIIDPKKQLEPLFKKWLKKNHFLNYILYILYFRIIK